jgi:hypothetical protein
MLLDQDTNKYRAIVQRLKKFRVTYNVGNFTAG